MAESLFSQSWYRVKDLKPRLRAHAQIHRQIFRGKDWYVLQDHSTGRFHRFSPEAYAIIGLMDGKRTVGEIWEIACERLGDDSPTQDEVIGLLSQLHQTDVLQADMPPDIADIYDRHVRGTRTRWMGRLRSPMALRFPLLDPERFLQATRFVGRLLFGWPGAVGWLTVVGFGVVLAFLHWQELTVNLADRVLAMENLLLLWWIYPVVKAFHEFGHAYAVKRWGGEIHEMGIMLLVLVPIPYVDASASSAFIEKGRRMIVGAAGILVELFLAGLAMIVWTNVEPGAVRAIAFNVMLIGGVSTLLFNGNPLLRFDAYYILSDFLEIPNLGLRATRYIGYLLRRHVLGVKEARSPLTAKGEGGWLGFYGVAAFCYRIFISLRIALFVAGKFFFVGVLLALWAAASMLLFPLFRVARAVFKDPELKRKGRRISWTICGAALVLALVVFKLPLPFFTSAEGVLWAPEDSRVHANADGFIVQIMTPPGTVVKRGTPLLRCENPDLESDVRVLETELRELEAKHRMSERTDVTEAEILKDEMERVRSEFLRAKERAAELLVRSPERGSFVLPDAQNLLHRFVKRGTPLGYVVDFSRVTARVVVTQSQVDLIRRRTMGVEVRLAENIQKVIPSSIVREVPGASKELPSLALSLEGGGKIVLDPQTPEEPKAFERLFQFEVALPGLFVDTIGARVFVRFKHDSEPLASRWYRAIRRVFLSRFDI